MKTLFLVRHAKSSWNEPALPDKDRPLNDRGKRDAPKMGERLAKHDVKPDLILSSPARRALTTAQIIAKKLNYKLKDILVDDRLYAVEADDLLHVTTAYMVPNDAPAQEDRSPLLPHGVPVACK